MFVELVIDLLHGEEIIMNLSFNRETSTRKKNDKTVSSAFNEYKLEEYKNILDNCKKFIWEYSNKLDDFDKRAMEYQPTITKTALDVACIKEMGDKTAKLLDKMKIDSMDMNHAEMSVISSSMEHMKVQLDVLERSMTVISNNMELRDRNLGERLSELVNEQQKQIIYQNKQFQLELVYITDKLFNSIKKKQKLLWIINMISILGFGSTVFLILYTLKVISF